MATVSGVHTPNSTSIGKSGSLPNIKVYGLYPVTEDFVQL